MMKALSYVLLMLMWIFSGLAQDDFEECPETERPSVWIDNAPDCQANSTYCDHFGLDYMCTNNITDDTNACFGGTKVMCLYPPTTPLAAPLPATTLKVIAYNVWELKYLVSQIGQRERTCRIPHELFKQQPDVDVIVFEEMFMGGCIVNVNNSLTVRDILTDYGFVHYTRTVGDTEALLPSSRAAVLAKRNTTADNGGVFITSRWPIIKEEQMVYENFDKTTSDALAAKGVMYARIQKTVDGSSKTFNIFGTHMQATEKPDSPGVRVLQAQEMHNFMEQMKIPADEPVLYAGDLNGDLIGKQENALAIIAALNSSMLERIGPITVTYDKEDNDNLDPIIDSQSQFLDYVLTSNAHEQPSKATLEIIRPRSDDAFTVCRKWRFLKFFQYPHSKDCGVTKRVTDLSDHYPVVGILDYSKDDVTFSMSTSPEYVVFADS
ncbi:sphingomyelinase C-like [Asterias rubens]|uniref:sphingomyelinase C-like n=1 Tax=Asterias rubens TaxID=7604 RepID=UPI0014559CD2|nr:sphingomyelinase C-like [Asterias rubens]